MKAAFVSTMTAARWGGSEQLWSATARAALDAGWEVRFSTRHWPEPAPAIQELSRRGATWHPRMDPSPRPGRPGWRRRVTQWRVGRSEREVRPASAFQAVFDADLDVICVSQGGTFDFLLHEDLCELIHASARPYVVLCRFNTDDLLIHEFLQPRAIAFLSGARTVAFAATRNIKTAERQLGARLPNASVVQSPINLPDASAVPWPAETGLRFACVARLEAAYKGQDLLLDALSTAPLQAREWHLSLYGDGPDRARLAHLVQFYGLADRVSFEGHVWDIRGIWARHHLLVLPSRAEGTPQSLIQAMICGRPAVVTDVGGASEWVSDGHTGFLAEAATPTSIARALERAWSRQTEWSAIGETAHLAAVERLDRTPDRTLLEMLRTAATSR